VTDLARPRKEGSGGASLAASPGAFLYLLTAAAVAFGLWGRFKGLGAWPLADDEYYMARAVQDILRVGTPQYECGGWYVRGLPYQYLVALLQLVGMPPEFSLRVVSAASSLLVLPAVYLLGRRAHGARVALLSVVILSVSVWEIETARFGRMYMPLQAIFTWYLVFFLRYTVDRDRRAWRPMLLLSLLGGITWEGGLLLMALNALPPFIGNTTGQLRSRDVRDLVVAGLLIVPVAMLIYSNLRMSSDVPPYSDEFYTALARPPLTWDSIVAMTLDRLVTRSAWLVAAIALTASVVIGSISVWHLRSRWLAAAGVLLAILLGVAHQFMAAACVLLLMALTRIVSMHELTPRNALPLHVSLGLSLGIWLAIGFGTAAFVADDSGSWLGNSKTIVVLYALFGMPDFLLQVIRPWVGAASFFGMTLLVLLGLTLRNEFRVPRSHSTEVSVLLLIVIVMLIAVGVSDPPRQATRYVSFLYPAVLVITLSTAVGLIGTLPIRSTSRKGVTWLLIFGAYLLSEDFRPQHVVAVDSPESNFRVRMHGRAETHLQPRTDPRGAALWINARANQTGDIAINGFPAASFYSDRFDFAYTDMGHQRYGAFACQRGTVERWSNLRLLASTKDLRREIELSRRAFLVVDTKQMTQVVEDLGDLGPAEVWRSIDGDVVVLEFDRYVSPLSGSISNTVRYEIRASSADG
jgi:hypothetical protein